MARPRLPARSVIVSVKFHLRPDEDADLIRFFASIPLYRRAAAVKAAMRSGGLTAGEALQQPDDADLLDLAEGLIF